MKTPEEFLDRVKYKDRIGGESVCYENAIAAMKEYALSLLPSDENEKRIKKCLMHWITFIFQPDMQEAGGILKMKS